MIIFLPLFDASPSDSHAPYCRFGRVSDMHFPTPHVMLMPFSEGEPYGTHSWALPPLSHRSSHGGRQDQSANLKHDPITLRFALSHDAPYPARRPPGDSAPGRARRSLDTETAPST